MRDCFVEKLTSLAMEDSRVCLLTADMGNNLFADIEMNCPGQFINCGIAEAAMIGMAGGLAKRGLKPFVYSIAPFITIRVLEQIKIDLAYNSFPATIVGMGAGLSYAQLGPTHHSVEDIGCLRLIPEIEINTPSCESQLRAQMEERLTSEKPCYIRLFKDQVDEIVDNRNMHAGHTGSRMIQKGYDVVLISMGQISHEAVNAQELMLEMGVGCTVLDIGKLRPFDYNAIDDLVKRCSGKWYVIEEHSAGGLYEVILTYLAETKQLSKIISINSLRLPDTFLHLLGSREFLLAKHGIDADGIVRRILGDR